MWKPMACCLTLALSSATVLIAGSLTGTVAATGMRNNADAVVFVDEIPNQSFPPPAEHVEMDQVNLTFVPHVLPVVVGTTVDFLNSDAFLHNVFTPDKCAKKFNLGSWPQGEIRSYTFEAPCTAVVLCNVHPEMEAYVLALPTPYFAVTDKSGAYTISGVPDGAYTVKVWHPKLKETSREVSVAGATTVDFELSR